MQLLGDKVLIRFTKENRESIFSKWVTQNDGTKIQLFLSVDVDAADERKSGLFVQTGIVEAVARSVRNILVGDTAIVDYMLCNDESKFVWEEDNGDKIYWTNAQTTFHRFDEIVYANRRTKHDTIVAKKGDIDELSSVYGIIRADQLIARQPFVFLQHEDNVIKKTTAMKIVYEEREESFERNVLASSEESERRYGLRVGDRVLVNDRDIFALKLDGQKVDCIMDMDIIGCRKNNLVG
jgi:co-chaperonin GroES (HSP10)